MLLLLTHVDGNIVVTWTLLTHTKTNHKIEVYKWLLVYFIWYLSKEVIYLYLWKLSGANMRVSILHNGRAVLTLEVTNSHLHSFCFLFFFTEFFLSYHAFCSWSGVNYVDSKLFGEKRTTYGGVIYFW